MPQQLQLIQPSILRFLAAYVRPNHLLVAPDHHPLLYRLRKADTSGSEALAIPAIGRFDLRLDTPQIRLPQGQMASPPYVSRDNNEWAPPREHSPPELRKLNTDGCRRNTSRAQKDPRTASINVLPGYARLYNASFVPKYVEMLEFVRFSA